jgi:hypothetical protein
MREIDPRRLERLTGRGLLPVCYEKLRLDTKVVEMPAGRYPSDQFTRATHSDSADPVFQPNDYDPSEIIGRTGNGQIVAMRKAYPHCQYGMMLVQDGGSQSSIVDLLPQNRNALCYAAADFANYAEENGLYPIMSFTHDPKTRDRKSGQSMAWFHMHLNSYTPKEKEFILDNAQPLSTYGMGTRRGMIDESTIIISQILSDYFRYARDHGDIEVFGPYELDGLPNFGTLIPGGWDSLRNGKLPDLACSIHNAVSSVHDMISGLVCEGVSGHWQRPILTKTRIDASDFPWMSYQTMEATNYFLDGLRPSVVDKRISHLMDPRNSKLTSHIYPLAGKSYGVTMSKHPYSDKILMSVRPPLFSETGAAGLHFAFSTVVRIKKGKKPYSQEELANIRQFEEGCISCMNSKP